MTSPSSTASSPIPGDAYFADLYPLASPVHSRSPSPICSPPSAPRPPPAASGKLNHDQHNPNQPLHNTHSQSHTHTHRPPPYRPRLDFASPKWGAYRPSLSFLPSGGTSPASVSASTSTSPLTPESPVGGSGGEGEKYTLLKEEERGFGGERVSAQKMKRRAQNRAAQRAFRARQTERVAELEREVEGLRRELEVLRGGLGGRG
ncbi:hypothetical protein VC83_02793 [Pseudogymnoascus destructans]|uniref:BZIP domain-containing protein n=1 Tax=Pseudogymnoascus destructans TaxID=655981 RepID=A0A177ACT9_9PEZI|nr:uncharacterized protein VC83_02793 [Pseudogymnoascus destructans]OAF59925.1 hypothetical protein VC83_02793 [Pseudogymnoascus destructans]